MTRNDKVIRVRVKVSAGVKKERVVQTALDKFKIDVKEKAERNMANKRVAEILVDVFDTKRVKLIGGHRKSGKIFEIRACTKTSFRPKI